MSKYLSCETFHGEMYDKLQEKMRHLSPLKPKLHVSETELQELVFALLGFSLALLQSLLSMSLFSSLGIVMGILCHCMLERCHLFSEFSRCHCCFECQKRLWEFKWYRGC